MRRKGGPSTSERLNKVARAQNLDGVLSTLSENFTLAKKPLAFMSDHYLLLRKHEFFDIR
jgi:hypothetical protein